MKNNKINGLILGCCLLPSVGYAEVDKATENKAEKQSDKPDPKENVSESVEDAANASGKRGVLTPEGRFVLDTSFNYSQNSSNKVSIVGYTVLPTLLVGRIEVSDSDRTTITLGLTGRYGITNRLEAEFRIPWVYRNDQLVTRPIQDGASDTTEVVTTDGSALGDIEAALRYQLNMDSAPYWVGSIRVKSTTGRSPYDISVNPTNNSLRKVPTGSGFWSVESGVSMIYPTDPAVLFMNMGYIYNIEDTVGSGTSRAKIDLGDTISFGAGMGFAVNPDFSFSLGLNHKTILKSKINGSSANNAQLLHLDTISLGTNFAVSDKLTVNVSAAAGLTEDSPDFQLTVRVPFRW